MESYTMQSRNLTPMRGPKIPKFQQTLDCEAANLEATTALGRVYAMIKKVPDPKNSADNSFQISALPNLVASRLKLCNPGDQLVMSTANSLTEKHNLQARFQSGNTC
mmetsp:Transcript_75694/g.165150  ORF Transcript_75694/g.165150 Transcript_75694/m.165150 type:complete len:107 (+) Transcript_75694:1002-1322(+)